MLAVAIRIASRGCRGEPEAELALWHSAGVLAESAHSDTGGETAGPGRLVRKDRGQLCTELLGGTGSCAESLTTRGWGRPHLPGVGVVDTAGSRASLGSGTRVAQRRA